MKKLLKTFGFIAFVAVLGLGFFTSCEEEPFEPSTITFTGVSEYFSKYGAVMVIDGGAITDTPIGKGDIKKITGSSITFDIVDFDDDELSLDGRFTVVFAIINLEEVNEADQLVFGGVITRSFSAGDNTIAFGSLNDDTLNIKTLYSEP